MDFASLKDQVANLSLYDLKAGVRKVQNAVMNYTEMEAKVREATNNEPWGASSTLMQDIANGTYSYQLLNEIMPMIYKRFTEKAAEEWRQIYKGLQLLEFLIKNGSERVVDDARSHLSLLKMLRQFQFIDQNGKDQGINVRNRAKELTDLLGDVDRIRAERKKARANRNKFGGVEGGGRMSGGISGGSRYGGFGSEDASFGGYSGGVYGDGGGFGGSTSLGFQDSGSNSRSDHYEEYDEGDDDTGGTPASARRKTETTANVSAKLKTEPKKTPEVDLFEFGDEEVPPITPPKPASITKTPSTITTLSKGATAPDDEEFDDFISATPTTQTSGISRGTVPGLPPPPAGFSVVSNTQIATPKPVSASQGVNMNDLVGFSSISPAPNNPLTAISTSSQINYNTPGPQSTQVQRPMGYQAAQPNYFTSVPALSKAPSIPTSSNTLTNKPSVPSANSFGSMAAKPAYGNDAFGNLWSAASASAGIKKNTSGTQGPKLADMAKEKASQGIWGATNTGTAIQAPSIGKQRPLQTQAQTYGGGLDDLLG